jgi:hypothetical protein
VDPAAPAAPADLAVGAAGARWGAVGGEVWAAEAVDRVEECCLPE